MEHLINELKDRIKNLETDEYNMELFNSIIDNIQNNNINYYSEMENPAVHVYIFQQINNCKKEVAKMIYGNNINTQIFYNASQIVIRWFMTQKLYDNIGTNLLVPMNKNTNKDLYNYLKKYLSISNEKIKMIDEYLISVCHKIYDKIEFINKQSGENQDIIILKKNVKMYTFYYKNINFELNIQYYKKLKNMYIHNIDNSTNKYLFQKRVFNLLCRYNTIFNPGYQAAIPVELFNLIANDLKVSHEMFASPLNSTLNSYTSAFYDTDFHFCSKGNIFSTYMDLAKNGGSFEANPPFTEDHMMMLVIIIEYILTVIEYPLSFFIIVPSWTDALSYQLLKNSKYNQIPNKVLEFKKYNHFYQNGSQYKIIDNDYKIANSPSSIFILQNDTGVIKYPINNTFLDKVNLTFISPINK